jgi:alkaline phosphatase
LNSHYKYTLKSILIFTVLSLILFIFGNCFRSETYPKNIIICIGDGMGVAHITAGKIAWDSLHLERFSVTGMVTTHSENELITESAAAATALATGHKTVNRAVSVSADKKPLKTVFEFAEELGKSTGVVVTSSVTHATPAAFFAHVEDRRQHSDIAEQVLNSGLDVLIGGGWAYFIPESNAGSRRQDDKNLLELLETRMPVVLSYDKLPAQGKNLAALLAPEGLPKSTDRDYALAALTSVAIGILSNDRNGFVLLIEGSQIDWAAHDQDQEGIVAELIDFDGAVGAGLDFAQKHGRTLVVVTGDHETGGFAVAGGSIKTNQVTSTGFTTTGHTAAMVPIFAYGPGSNRFNGIQDNTRVGQNLIALLLKREMNK